MPNLYDEFENKYKFSWFSASWVEAESKPVIQKEIKIKLHEKDLATLETELKAIEENIEIISQKQLRLANLAKFYQ